MQEVNLVIAEFPLKLPTNTIMTNDFRSNVRMQKKKNQRDKMRIYRYSTDCILL